MNYIDSIDILTEFKKAELDIKNIILRLESISNFKLNSDISIFFKDKYTKEIITFFINENNIKK